MQSLDTLDTLHYSLRGPASGNTSLPDVDSSRFAGCTSGARTDWALGGLPCSSAALVCSVVLPALGRCQRHGGRMRPPQFQRWDERANVHEGNEHSLRVSTRLAYMFGNRALHEDSYLGATALLPAVCIFPSAHLPAHARVPAPGGALRPVEFVR